MTFQIDMTLTAGWGMYIGALLGVMLLAAQSVHNHYSMVAFMRSRAQVGAAIRLQNWLGLFIREQFQNVRYNGPEALIVPLLIPVVVGGIAGFVCENVYRLAVWGFGLVI